MLMLADDSMLNIRDEIAHSSERCSILCMSTELHAAHIDDYGFDHVYTCAQSVDELSTC